MPRNQTLKLKHNILTISSNQGRKNVHWMDGGELPMIGGMGSDYDDAPEPDDSSSNGSKTDYDDAPESDGSADSDRVRSAAEGELDYDEAPEPQSDLSDAEGEVDYDDAPEPQSDDELGDAEGELDRDDDAPGLQMDSLSLDTEMVDQSTRDGFGYADSPFQVGNMTNPSDAQSTASSSNNWQIASAVNLSENPLPDFALPLSRMGIPALDSLLSRFLAIVARNDARPNMQEGVYAQKDVLALFAHLVRAPPLPTPVSPPPSHRQMEDDVICLGMSDSQGLWRPGASSSNPTSTSEPSTSSGRTLRTLVRRNYREVLPAEDEIQVGSPPRPTQYAPPPGYPTPTFEDNPLLPPPPFEFPSLPQGWLSHASPPTSISAAIGFRNSAHHNAARTAATLLLEGLPRVGPINPHIVERLLDEYRTIIREALIPHDDAGSLLSSFAQFNQHRPL